MNWLGRTKEAAETQILSVESMLGELHELGHVTLTSIKGQWWCYFDVRKGAAEISIKGDRKDGWSMYEAIANCYRKVKEIA